MTDLSLMPFGKFKGTIMQEVPVSYLHYLWTSGFDKIKPDSEPTTMHETNSKQVAMYIRDNLTALKDEDSDRIW